MWVYVTSHATCKHSDAFWALDFMGGHAGHGDGGVAVVCFDVADGLGAVGEEGDVLFCASFGEGVDVLYEAGFVVDVHDASQDGVRTEGCSELVFGDASVVVDVEVSDVHAEGFEVCAGVEDGFVLGLDGDDVVALVAVGFPIAFDGEVDGFRGAGGEDDFFGQDVDVLCYAFTGIVDGLLCYLAIDVLAVGVAKVLREVGQHGFQYFGVDRSGGGGVEVFGELDVGDHQIKQLVQPWPSADMTWSFHEVVPLAAAFWVRFQWSRLMLATRSGFSKSVRGSSLQV